MHAPKLEEHHTSGASRTATAAVLDYPQACTQTQARPSHTYLVLVDEVSEAKEQRAGGHDERADHRVHEADDEDQEEGRVHLFGARSDAARPTRGSGRRSGGVSKRKAGATTRDD